MRSFGWFSEPNDVFDRPDEDVARNGTQYERSTLASREHVTREAFLILAETGDVDIQGSLAMNYSTPPDILDKIAEIYPDLHEQASTNCNASPELKKTAPLSEHPASSIEDFLRDVHATDDEARALVKQQGKLCPPGGPLLGEVWAQIRPPEK